MFSGAGIAQLVVHLICNQGVGGSSPSAGTNKFPCFRGLRRRSTSRPARPFPTVPNLCPASFAAIAGALGRLSLGHDNPYLARVSGQVIGREMRVAPHHRGRLPSAKLQAPVGAVASSLKLK